MVAFRSAKERCLSLINKENHLVPTLCVGTHRPGRSASRLKIADCKSKRDAERPGRCVPTQSVGTRWFSLISRDHVHYR